VPKRLSYDRWLFVTTLALVGGGLFMVGSASGYLALDFGKSPSVFWWRHAVHLLLGFAAMLAVLQVPYAKLARPGFVWGLLALCATGLIVARAMPAAGGAHRWIFLGPFRLQPSEFTKLATVLFMAWLLSRDREERGEAAPWGVPALGVVGLLGYLVAVENLGSAVVLVAVAGVMAFFAGLRFRLIAALAAVGGVVFALFVIFEPYRWQRITAFADPWADPRDGGFQLIQSLIAFGNGGVAGVGLGQGQQKALFLPAAHTDFIFSIVGEELGLIGALTLLCAFLLLFWRGMRVALRAPDRFGSFLALGLTCLLVLQALINMCICVGLLPTTGLPLPFISYGGSSLLVSMTAMGLLLNVSQHAE
jgi:cell division protein FtsW